MKYLLTRDGFWKIDMEADKIYWTSNDLDKRNDYIRRYGSIWVEQTRIIGGGVTASRFNATLNYPEVSEGELMLELI